MANMSSISINKRADDQFKKLTRIEDQGSIRIRSPRRRAFVQDRAPQGASAGARRGHTRRRADEEGRQDEKAPSRSFGRVVVGLAEETVSEELTSRLIWMIVRPIAP